MAGCSDHVSFAVGSKYNSYEVLHEAIQKYQKQNFVQLYKKDSHTVQVAARRSPKRHFNEAIKYSEITFSCIHGGKKYISKSKGARPHQL